jgi:hypothetical protein
MLRFIPPDTIPWKGEITHQYTCPAARAGGTAPVGCVDRQVASLRMPNFQPGEAGQPHLGAQPQQPFRFDLLDAPEVERLAHKQPIWVAPAPAPATPPMNLSIRPRTLHPSGKETSRARRRSPRSPATPPVVRLGRSLHARRYTGCRRPTRGRWVMDHWALPGCEVQGRAKQIAAKSIHRSRWRWPHGRVLASSIGG